MPKGTGLGGCDPGFTPAQCALYKLGMKAIGLEEKCMKVGAQWQSDLVRVNAKRNATEAQCEAINNKYKLGIGHPCCKDIWAQGCAFTSVRGSGGVAQSLCRQFKPVLQGASQSCHYAKAVWHVGNKSMTGDEVIQNSAESNFVHCTKWESHHHLATLLPSDKIGFRTGPSGTLEEEMPDPLAAIEAKKAMAKAGEINHHPTVGRTPKMTPKTDLEDEDLVEIGERTSRRGFTNQYFQRDQTTVSVVTKAKKEVSCSFCSTSRKKSLVWGNENNPKCKLGARRVCTTKTTLRCERVCFLIGRRGSLVKGERPWRQAFRVRHCPVGRIIEASNSTSLAMHNMRSKYHITQSSTVFTKPNITVPEPVTLTNIGASLQHLPPIVSRRVLRDNYDSDDENLKMCCFPGCMLPAHTKSGDNPWYWYDTRELLQEAISAEVSHTF
jgi:hypothetical protein